MGHGSLAGYERASRGAPSQRARCSPPWGGLRDSGTAASAVGRLSKAEVESLSRICAASTFRSCPRSSWARVRGGGIVAAGEGCWRLCAVPHERCLNSLDARSGDILSAVLREQRRPAADILRKRLRLLGYARNNLWFVAQRLPQQQQMLSSSSIRAAPMLAVIAHTAMAVSCGCLGEKWLVAFRSPGVRPFTGSPKRARAISPH